VRGGAALRASETATRPAGGASLRCFLLTAHPPSPTANLLSYSAAATLWVMPPCTSGCGGPTRHGCGRQSCPALAGRDNSRLCGGPRTAAAGVVW